MAKISVLLVDDDLEHRTAFSFIFKDWGYDLTMAKDGFEAVKLCVKKRFDAIVMDIKMDGLDGLQALAFIKKNERAEPISGFKGESMNAQTPVIMLTGYATVKDAVQAMKDGAYDFLIKGDVEIDILRLKINNALEHHKLKEAKEASIIGEQNLIMGRSPAFRKIVELVERIAPSMANVLLTGESGVGKEVVARLIWSKSPRANQLFATCNCSAVSKETVEDSLFGHRKGAFTGAVTDRQGILKSAEGGTVFLDEIGETTPQFQTKLLRALQEREIQPLGSDQAEKVDVRFLAATNVDLETVIQSGKFREDIYHRFTFKIRVPSLRERLEDLPELANYYLQRYAMRNGREVAGFSPAAMDILLNHSWPGNIRELQNAMEYVVVMMASDQVTETDLPESLTTPVYHKLPHGTQAAANPAATQAANQTANQAHGHTAGQATDPAAGQAAGHAGEALSLKEAEKNHILSVLEKTHGVKKKAADMLRISRKTLSEKIKAYQLTQYMSAKDGGADEDEGEADFDGPDDELPEHPLRH
ncbi:MAG: sigma-54 dependent transcriptional regulator [Deltaproteobacteria bacterium]|jgi:two-component system response regulator HydG|nr:sigma-54 dependent transcriptional regulator [Deltaproteobacteria bacterium]